MLDTICFFEDSKYKNFFPLTHLRPVFELRSGIVPLYKRADRYFKFNNLVLCPRTSINGHIAEKYPNIPVNIIKKGEGDLLCLNSRIRDYGNLAELVKTSQASTVFSANNETKFLTRVFNAYDRELIP